MRQRQTKGKDEEKDNGQKKNREKNKEKDKEKDILPKFKAKTKIRAKTSFLKIMTVSNNIFPLWVQLVPWGESKMCPEMI